MHVLAEDTLHSIKACLHGSINHDHFNHSETLCLSFAYWVPSPCHFVLNICICKSAVLKFWKEFYCQSCIAGVSFISLFYVGFLPSYLIVCPGSRFLSFLKCFLIFHIDLILFAWSLFNVFRSSHQECYNFIWLVISILVFSLLVLNPTSVDSSKPVFQTPTSSSWFWWWKWSLSLKFWFTWTTHCSCQPRNWI